MKIEAFKDKLGNWLDLFQPFIESEEMDKIYSKLKSDSSAGKIICPDSNQTFRVFKELDRHKVHTIWYLQDPYPTIKNGIKVASGIAMDCSATGVIQPSLNLFWNAVHREVYDNLEYKYTKNPSLLPLVEQGIMFINTDLTCQANISGSHKGLWKEFQKYFIQKILNEYYTGLIFILSGKTSQELEEYIGPNHHILKTEHPVAASYQNREWNTNNSFKEMEIILHTNNNISVSWIPEFQRLISECPF